MPLSGDFKHWPSNRKIGAIRDVILANNGEVVPHSGSDCVNCAVVYPVLEARIGVKPVSYSRKINGVWVAKPLDEARRLLRNEIREIHAYMTSEPSERVATPTEVEALHEALNEAPIRSEGLSDDQALWLSEVRRLRGFAASRDLDHISLRPVKDGMRMIAAGISVKACMHAMTLTWSEADRRQAGIQSFDPATDHPGGLDAYLLCLVRAEVTIFLYGGAGMGKSYWTEQLPERLGMPGRYGMTPMTEGATPSWLLGKVDLEGFKPTRLLDIWVNGGVYLFDEADASDPNMLLVMNGPLASKVLHNPVDQAEYVKSPKCVLIFAGNTCGDGADAMYGARNELDFSTKDRLRMGRVEVGYDANVEMIVALANADLGEDVFGIGELLAV